MTPLFHTRTSAASFFRFFYRAERRGADVIRQSYRRANAWVFAGLLRADARSLRPGCFLYC